MQYARFFRFLASQFFMAGEAVSVLMSGDDARDDYSSYRSLLCDTLPAFDAAVNFNSFE